MYEFLKRCEIWKYESLAASVNVSLDTRTRFCLCAAVHTLGAVKSFISFFYLASFDRRYSSVVDARKFLSIEMAAKVASNGKGFQPVSNSVLIPHTHSSRNPMRNTTLWAIDCDHNLILSFHRSLAYAHRIQTFT